MKILVVDDSIMQQNIARIYLEKGEGHEMATANNGKIGYEKAKSEQPDLILLDIEMPVMNGEETLEALKSDPETQSIPVIICSSLDEPELMARLKTKGAADNIKKPTGFSTLKEKINIIFSVK